MLRTNRRAMNKVTRPTAIAANVAAIATKVAAIAAKVAAIAANVAHPP